MRKTPGNESRLLNTGEPQTLQKALNLPGDDSY